MVNVRSFVRSFIHSDITLTSLQIAVAYLSSLVCSVEFVKFRVSLPLMVMACVCSPSEPRGVVGKQLPLDASAICKYSILCQPIELEIGNCNMR